MLYKDRVRELTPDGIRSVIVSLESMKESRAAYIRKLEHNVENEKYALKQIENDITTANKILEDKEFDLS